MKINDNSILIYFYSFAIAILILLIKRVKMRKGKSQAHDKRYFVIDQQIVRNSVPYNECLSNPPISSMQLKQLTLFLIHGAKGL